MAKVRNPEQVPGVGIASDPGVRASPNAFGAQIGASMQELGSELGRIANTANTLRKKRESLTDATILNDADINLDNAHFDLQEELDNSGAEDADEQFIARSEGLAEHALTAAEEVNGGAQLSSDARSKWQIRAAQMRNRAARRQAINTNNRMLANAETKARTQFDDLRSFVFKNPGATEEAMGKADQLRENLLASGIGDIYIDSWIGTTEQMEENFYKVKALAKADPNHSQFNPSETLDQMRGELNLFNTSPQWMHGQPGAVDWGKSSPGRSSIKAKTESLSAITGQTLKINSFHRDEGTNKKVGGTKNSEHLKGNAVDISLEGKTDMQKQQITAAAVSMFNRTGAYTGENALHADDHPLEQGEEHHPMFEKSIKNFDKAPAWYRNGVEQGLEMRRRGSNSGISPVGKMLINEESKGRINIENNLGYAGIVQMGAPRAAELRLYRPHDKENLDTWSTTPYKRRAGSRKGKSVWEKIPGTYKWEGVWKIPGMGEMTHQQWLDNPQAQVAVWKAHERSVVDFIHANGLDQYIGETRFGVPITMNSMIAGAHIRGEGGMKQFVLSGKTGPADANGTTVVDYMRRAANIVDGSPDPVFSRMSPEDQQLIRNRAQAAYVKQQQADQQILSYQQQEFRDTFASSVSSAQNTGQTVPWDDVAASKVLGWDEVNAQISKEGRALNRYAATAPMSGMSKSEMERHVLGLEASAGAQTGQIGHADAVDAADFSRRKMAQIKRQRDTAPAEAAIMGDSRTRQLLEAHLADRRNPAKAQQYVSHSIRVQQGYGLDQPSTKQGVDELKKATRGNIQHLPDALLDEIAKDFEDIPIISGKTGDELREAKKALHEELRQKYNELKGVFGQFTNEIILEAYGHMERNDGTDEVAIRAVKEIVRAGGAKRATTKQEKQEEVGWLKQLTQDLTIRRAQGASINILGLELADIGAETPIDENLEEAPEPSDAPVMVPKSQEDLLNVAKEFARRGNDFGWLDEQNLSETQRKVVLLKAKVKDQN